VLFPGEHVEPFLPLGGDRVQRWVWHGRFKAVLSEVVGNDVCMSDQLV